MSKNGHVVALCGGVGGAKLAFGLSRILDPGDLTIVVNTGDDFEHLGLSISPDIDTVVYTLSGLADRQKGWGRANETWNFLAALEQLGGETWFRLGDRDLSMHIERTRRMRAGETLSDATGALSRALGVRHAIVPMSDQPVRTMVRTDSGELAFQHYFVRERCAPRVSAIRFNGAERASLSPLVQTALTRSDLAAVILCPSNPYLSIDPILAVPGMKERLASISAPIVAVSPLIGGEAVKGPTAKLMREMHIETSIASIADHYREILCGLVIDEADRGEAAALRDRDIAALVTQTLMKDEADRERLARETLDFALRLPRRNS